MKVLIVNTFDRGGAANACLRLHEGLLNAGVDSKVLLKHKSKQLLGTFRFDKSKTIKFHQKVLNKLINIIPFLKKKHDESFDFEEAFLSNRSPELEMFSFPHSNYDITKSHLYQEADIINLHWVAGFLDYESFFKKNSKPVIWTLHDMNPFSGGEHYEQKYFGMDDFGRPIKRQVPDEEAKIVKLNIAFKQRLLESNNNVTIVAPSKWLANSAKESQVFHDKDIYCIPYGLNSNLFSPKDQRLSREELKIPIDKKVILFVADSLDNHRKGFRYLQKAIEKLDIPNIVLCSIGDIEKNLNFKHEFISLGTIKNESLMCAAYSAADVFVIPSMMDNLPNTVIESLFCGTPVIGFPVGGITDMIKHGENGLLTNEISVDNLHRTLQEFFESNYVFNAEKIRKQAVEKYNLDVQAQNYKMLFEKILKQQKT